jgi:UPF0755 protein
MMISEPRPPVIIIGDPKEHQKLPKEVVERRRSNFLMTLFILGICGAVVWSFFRPAEALPGGAIVSYEEAVPLETFLEGLKDKGVIRSVILTRLLVGVYGSEKKVPAGEYFIREGEWLPSIAKQLAKGDHQIPTIKVTFPEGMTSREMADLLGKRIPGFDEKTFLSLAEAQEGYLFPNTYEFFATVKPPEIIDKLQEEYKEQVGSLKEELERSGYTEKEMVIMASILEGEVNTSEDRVIVAGILWKRIGMKMPLQVDATFVYLLGKGSEELTLTDLSVDSPYNTYRNKGLPPGPINNPGLEAMRSAITPKDSPYLFYLSDKEGVTHYAKTFDEHKANKAKYLR